ncbi:transposase [Geomonas sp.]|uniref:transposase n=1 Tax=Geomonas sp. TaxID=2651584 RepID=UPI002B47FA88|nr:transposase [Geomonas sp.]HJV36178.1 transposase [Geomonas sp.]
MPRLARLDAVGVLQHVMVRGIEKRDIFLDDKDRERFLAHFSELLIKTDTSCLAWSLMTNHLHLLLRPEKTKLSFFMRRLLTSYAVGFNVRHDRAGHLFQNRYRSIVCEEEPYLLELIRYIHLNPLRAGIVSNGDELKRYRWSGHAVLMGETELPGQVTSEVLCKFGNSLGQAREKYNHFVMDAVVDGRQDELDSRGEVKGHFILSGENGEEAYDSRVLGSGEFVEQLWENQEQEVDEPKIPLSCLLQEVATIFQIDVQVMCKPSKRDPIPKARAVLCYLGQRELGYSGTVIARLLAITPAAVTRAADRGQALVKEPSCNDLLLKIRMLKS